MKHIMLLLALACAPMILMQAQPPERGRFGRGGSPEDMAQRQTEAMVDSLNLSTAQGEKINEVNVKFAEQMSEMRRNNRGDFMAMREKMGTMREEQSVEWKKYLTDAQFQKWQVISERQRANRGDRNRRGEKGKRKKTPTEKPNGTR